MENPEQIRALYQISQAITSVEQSLTPAVAGQLRALSAGMGSALAGNNQAAFRNIFQQLYVMAATQARNPALLQSIQPYLRPVLGFAGVTWARMEICGAAIAAILASEALAMLMTVILYVVIAAIVIFLIYMLLKLLYAAWNWVPAQNNPQPTQTPDWSRLRLILLDPTFGPAYCINNGSLPSGIEIKIS
ncbi:MAG: hypothetical protein ABJA66_00485 [Actinomycetota bacterium]